MKLILLVLASTMVFSSCAQKFIHEEKNFIVEEDCLKNLNEADKQIFLRMLNSGFNDGLACMEKIGTKTSMAVTAEIRKTLGQQKVKIFCPEKYDDEFSIAHADAPAFKHPYGYLTITLDNHAPDFMDGLNAVILHEIIHLPGYRHEIHIDYPVACSAYCFPKESFYEEDLKSGTDAAYRICGGQFTSVDDEEYIRYYTRVSVTGGAGTKAMVETILAFIDRNPKSRYAKFLLAMSLNGNRTWLVGNRLMELLDEKYAGETLSTKEKEYSDYYRRERDKHLKDFSGKNLLIEISKPIANAFFHRITGDSELARKEASSIELNAELGETMVKKYGRLLKTLK